MHSYRIIMLFMLVLAAPPLFAQYTGPAQEMVLTTVQKVRADAPQLDKSDTHVQLQGYVIRQVSGDTYEFKDSTGTVMLEIDKKDMPAEPFNEHQLLLITGEVDYDVLGGVEVEAEQIILVKK